MNRRMIVSVAAGLSIFLGLNLYVGWNGAVFWSFALPEVPVVWYWVLYAVLALSYIGAMVLRRRIPYRLFVWLKMAGAYGMALQFYALLLALPADLAVWLLRLNGAAPGEAVLWAGGTALVILAGLLLWGSRNAWSTVVRSYDLEVDKRAWDGRKELRIAAASDLHLGTVVGNRHLARLVRHMRRLKPDLILLPGDVLDDSIEPFIRENMADVLKGLQAPLGVYACLGNHEYIGGHIEEYIGRMRAIGIEVLTDKTVLVADSFYVVGRKDKAAERFRQDGRLALEELLAGSDRSLPVILLDHQPYGFGAAAEAGVDLMLSGHTHRGQMAPNHWITRRLFELDWGYMRKGAMHALVSSGYGFWGPPIRIGSRSEILSVRLRFRQRD